MNNRGSRPSEPGGAPARQPAANRKPPPGRKPSPARQPPGRQPPQERDAARRVPEKRKPRSESRWFRAILMVLATLAGCFFLAIFALNSANDLFGLNQADEVIEINIPEKATLADVSDILTKEGVVEQYVTFNLYASLKEQTYLPGTYMFNSNMGYEELLIQMRNGSAQKEEVTLTFIEGENVYEIATKLEENKVCGAEEFLECLETTDFGYEFMDRLPENALRFRKLEGYLFPDTYDFYVDEGPESVARKFLRNFSDKITGNMQTKMNDLNLTLDEAVTLASVIQKEAGLYDEMTRVSSVFHNRLALPEVYPRLQSDVTRDYATNFIVPFHDIRNQEMYDAYNTYVREGLPVGPICNPGMDAIEAALYPTSTEYYFFVTDVQESYYYSVTAEQHYEKVRIAAAVEGEGEIHGVSTEE